MVLGECEGRGGGGGGRVRRRGDSASRGNPGASRGSQGCAGGAGQTGRVACREGGAGVVASFGQWASRVVGAERNGTMTRPQDLPGGQSSDATTGAEVEVSGGEYRPPVAASRGLGQ